MWDRPHWINKRTRSDKNNQNKTLHQIYKFIQNFEGLNGSKKCLFFKMTPVRSTVAGTNSTRLYNMMARGEINSFLSPLIMLTVSGNREKITTVKHLRVFDLVLVKILHQMNISAACQWRHSLDVNCRRKGQLKTSPLGNWLIIPWKLC